VAAFLWDEADAEKQQQDFRRWSEAEPEGDTGDGSVNALTIRSDHSVGAGHPLQPHPSPLPACSRVQRQPIDPPRKHPIRAQTAAGCSALSAHPTTCYKTQISLQQHTASRCSVCALISQGLHMLALNGPPLSHQTMRWTSRWNKAGYASHRVRPSDDARRVYLVSCPRISCPRISPKLQVMQQQDSSTTQQSSPLQESISYSRHMHRQLTAQILDLKREWPIYYQ